jgi:hypothetical protein
MFDEISQESDKIIKQNLEAEEEENDERQTITTAQQRMKQQLSVVTAEVVMFITTEEKKPPASHLERKSVETKLKEGIKPSEVKPYVDNLGGSTQEVMDVVVEDLFDKPNSAKKVVNAKKDVIEISRAKRKMRRPRIKRREKRRRLPILMEIIVIKEVCERKTNLELEILNQGGVLRSDSKYIFRIVFYLKNYFGRANFSKYIE